MVLYKNICLYRVTKRMFNATTSHQWDAFHHTCTNGWVLPYIKKIKLFEAMKLSCNSKENVLY